MTTPTDDDASDAPARTAFDWIGGEERVRALVDRFYDLMDLEPAYAELRAAHGSDLASARQKLFWFLCGWLGGPDHYQSRFGHPMLRARHLPYPIGIRERDQWIACMHQAMCDLDIDPELVRRLDAAFANTADWMRNKSG
jgi:hemoglobin